MCVYAPQDNLCRGESNDAIGECGRCGFAPNGGNEAKVTDAARCTNVRFQEDMVSSTQSIVQTHQTVKRGSGWSAAPTRDGRLIQHYAASTSLDRHVGKLRKTVIKVHDTFTIENVHSGLVGKFRA